MRSRALILLLSAVVLAWAAPAARAATFTVTVAEDGDDGACTPVHCTLREAIAAANTAVNADRVAFAIGTGAKTVSLTETLFVSQPVTIDGWSQPGWTHDPIITIATGGGFQVAAPDSEIRGLRVGFLSFTGDDAVLRGTIADGGGFGTLEFTGARAVVGGTGAADGNRITANLSIGGADSVVHGNDLLAVATFAPATITGNTITERAQLDAGAVVGGPAAADRNTIGGPVQANGDAVIEGNRIGVTADGMQVVEPTGGGGIEVGGSGADVTITGNTIGGRDTGVGVASGGRAVVRGNHIGIDSAGTGAVANVNGVVVSGGAAAEIGGTGPGEGNVISGNTNYAIASTSGDLTITGNRIGTRADGTRSVPNGGGILLSDAASGTMIGGTAPGAGNLIAGNASEGVFLLSSAGSGNSVLGNRMERNGGLGIELASSRGRVNDPFDADEGPNDLQNYPVLAAATPGDGDATATGTLTSASDTAYRIEVFASKYCDPRGHGEGGRLVGVANVTTGPDGTVPLAIDLDRAVAQGEAITATATDPNGSTSEFSDCVDAGERQLVTPGDGGTGATNGAVAWSTDGFEGQPTEVARAIVSAAPDGSGLTPLTTSAGGDPLDVGPQYSPDGNHIAFTRCAGGMFGCGVSSDIWMMDADGSNLHLLVEEATAASWSPDGETIAYARVHHGESSADAIFRIRADGFGGPQRVTPASPTCFGWGVPHYLPSGELLIAGGCGGGYEGGLSRVPAEGGTPVTEALSTGELAFPSGFTDLSPDGRYLMMGFEGDAVVYDRETGEYYNLTRGEERAVRAPVWSPDGTKILGVGPPDEGQRGGEVWVADADGRNAHPITDNEFQDEVGDWQPCIAGVTVQCGPPAPFDLTVSLEGDGDGTVTSDPSGIDCGSDCEGSFSRRTQVTLSAAAAAGSSFAGWAGDCAGSDTTCVVSMDAARNVTATFTDDPDPDPFALTVSRAGDGSGAVTSTPAGIDCGADCAESYAPGTSVTLTAAAAAGSTFAGWSGDCSGTGDCAVQMDSERNVTATFTDNPDPDPDPFALTVSRLGDGSGTVRSTPAGIDCGLDCAESYAPGTSVTLTAAAAAGSTFAGWSGDCSGTGDCVVQMDSARNVTATFTDDPDPDPDPFALTVSRLGDGSGTVRSTPAGIDCGLDCAESYAPGTSVTLTAAAAAGSTFAGWSGDCAGSATTCTVAMNAARTATASFAKDAGPGDDGTSPKRPKVSVIKGAGKCPRRVRVRIRVPEDMTVRRAELFVKGRRVARARNFEETTTLVARRRGGRRLVVRLKIRYPGGSIDRVVARLPRCR